MSAEEASNSGKIFDRQIIKRLYIFVKPYRFWFILLVVSTIMAGASAALRPYLIQKIVDENILTGNWTGLYALSLILLGLILSQGLLEYLDGYLSIWLGQNIIKSIRLALYKHLLAMRAAFYDHTPIGRLITRNISDIENIADIFTEGMASIAGDVLQLSFLLIMMFYSDWRLTLITLSVLPFLLGSTYVFKEYIKSSFNEVRTAVSNLNTFVQEHITGMQIVQLFTAEEREYKKFEEINKTHLQANLKSVLAYSIYFPVAEVLAAIGTGLLVWYGAQGVLKENISIGTLIAFIMYIAMFFRPIRMIADKFNTLQMGIVCSARVLKLLDDNTEVQNSGKITEPLNGKTIVFDHVDFGYLPEQPILKDLSFVLEPGKTLAIVGSTGAGKSTIIQLINRFYEIDRGKITIGKYAIQDYDLAHLRKNIGFVLQDVFLFSGTLLENITLGESTISLEKINSIIDKIGARTLINQLPDGLNYNVTERGLNLSVGQRQLISFIRALVFEPAILVLDEATSSVDSETEKVLQLATDQMLKNRTCIVIAHRLATIQHAHNIMVLDKGEILEQGTHSELLNKNGAYSRLYQYQFKV
jgi:ATP-binding cassette subfamily B multidrug efflux pump